MALWVEKYRPKSVEDIENCPHEIASILDPSLLWSMPHLILHGPPGTGKSSAVRLICKRLFPNKNTLKDRVLELNASDDRNAKVVRETIKGFASRAINHVDESPDIKVIVLEESDALDDESQAALRRIIEVHSASTRFIFVCNFLGNVIKPIISRCLLVHFKQCSKDQTIRALQKLVARMEDARCTQESSAFALIHAKCGGDMRKAVNMLQQQSMYARAANRPLLGWVRACKDEKEICSLVEGELRQAKNPCDLVNEIFQDVAELSCEQILALADADFALANGGNGSIQLLNLFLKLK